MCEALWSSGVPREVLQFVPGPGSTVGAYLVKDPRVAVIGFTGSREVGFDILKAAGQLTIDHPGAKKVVCEMGGKNAVIVDSTADLDEAVLGVRDSAFGYAGQKCSACSRVIVLKDAYPSFVERLCEATASLSVGDPLDPGTDIGPVIDDSAAQGIWQYIEAAKTESKLQLAVDPPQPTVNGKPLIGPHIFTDVLPEHTLAREEVFGPVLAVMVADSFEQALQLANDSPFKLTGGVFSRTPMNLQLAKRRFIVGNLYLNRGCTGALVGRQPFGGFGHSGTGTKAGGQDYLKHFVNPIVCCENTMRRGFAPGLD
jgi:RHH-type proline utilization regulon transcriptional repressor/proline dehydrogenase/delta 1-pyrroline-5-carboxylate dehydrogenase